MIGYKIAVGVSEEHGFFPVIVELEIPEDAIIVTPLLGIPLFGKNGELELVTKYRTNTCKVVKVSPLDVHPFNNKSYYGWNGNAFSIYELVNWYMCIRTVYKVCNIISVKYVDEDIKHDCGDGIHFFGSADDAEKFYNGDAMSWVYSALLSLNGTVVSFVEGDDLFIYRDVIKKTCLSFE